MDKKFILRREEVYNDEMPIAKIVNKFNRDIITNNDEYIYITTEKYNNKIEYNNNQMLSFTKFLNNKNISLSNRDYEKIKEYFNFGNDRFINNELRDIIYEYELMRDKDLYLNDYKYTFQILPYINNQNPRFCYFIGGKSGSGKSYTIARLLHQYNFYFKNSPIYLISEKENDENYKGIKNLERINKEELINLYDDLSPYLYFKSDTGQSLVICDDIEIYKKDKNFSEILTKVMDSIITVGRSSGISFIYVNHGLVNMSQSNISLILFESTRIIIFPESTIKSQLKYFLEKRLMLDNDIINRILKLNSKQCTIDTISKCIISDNEIFFF